MQWGRCYKTLPLICKINCLQGHTCDCYRSTGYIRSLTVIFLAHVGLTMSTLLVYRQITHTGRCFFFFFFFLFFFLIPPLTRAKPITCTYFLVTGLRVHLGCRSGAAAEGWSSRSRRGSVGALGVALSESELSGRERRAFLGVLVFHLYSQIFRDIGTRSLPLPVFLFSSYPRRRRLPVLLPPQKTKKKTASLSVSLPLSLCRRVVAVYSRAGLSLSAFSSSASPCLWPHPASPPLISLSVRSCAALQPCRGAGPLCRRPDTGSGRAGSARGAAAEAPAHKCKERGVEVWGALIASTSTALHITSSPMHQCCAAAAYCPRMMMKRNTHVTLLTSPSKLIEDT